VVPKDSVNVSALKQSTFFLSECWAHFDSRNHFIEFDPAGDALYFVAHIFPWLGMWGSRSGSGSAKAVNQARLRGSQRTNVAK